MKISCPSCESLIPSSNLNVATDVAFCETCNEAFAISSLVASGSSLADFDINQPPRGAWFEDLGTGWRIGATTRSPSAFFLVPFMCVWSGFSLGGIYGTQIVKGEFNLMMSLFGIPFVLGTLLFGTIAVMSVCGKLVISTDRDQGSVFTGVGPIGWTRRFDWTSISGVEESYRGYRDSRGSGLEIALIGQSRIKCGGMLTEPRRYYILQGLRGLLAKRD